MPQEDCGAGELEHSEKVCSVVFPANDDAAKIMKPSEHALDLPAAAVALLDSTVLGGWFAAVPAVRRDQLYAERTANRLLFG